MSKRVCITDFFVKKVPRQELTQSIVVKTNIEESNPDNEYSCSRNQIQHEHVHCDSQVSLFDIKLYVGQTQKLSNKEKIEYFHKTWTPESTFVFPTSEFNKKKLKFQLNWLEKWKWLAYSQINDGAYCKYCVVFFITEGGIGCQTLGNFCLKPFRMWYKAIEKFNHHEKCNYHLQSVEQYQNIVAVETGKQDSIDLQLNKAAKVQTELNRKIIIPVIESIIFCGRQGIALRGHLDFGTLTIENPVENDGNFRALMRFHLNATKLSGDESYQLARTNCAKNAQYTSWKIQNEIIGSCHEIILSEIVNEVNNSKCFLVIADETADVAGIEQFSICVRYFDSKTKIVKEQFLKFVPVMDLSGSALASIIINELTEMKIEVQYLRGQGYDGAASMSGRFNGVQACIKKEYKTAIYVHCSSHSLNLAVSYACGLQGIRILWAQSKRFIHKSINDRFINHKEIIQGFQMLFPIAPLTKQQEKLIENLVEFYANDLEDSLTVLAEVKIWHYQVFKIRLETNLKMVTAIEVISNCNNALYPNTYKLLTILLTLPVTSCEAERSFLTLKRIKTYLRNSTADNRLNGLAALNIHREIKGDIDAVIKELAKKKRRLDFVI
ncbi:hypothetical protein QTP88_015314 [Uroleucon formosanum]